MLTVTKDFLLCAYEKLLMKISTNSDNKKFLFEEVKGPFFKKIIFFANEFTTTRAIFNFCRKTQSFSKGLVPPLKERFYWLANVVVNL